MKFFVVVVAVFALIMAFTIPAYAETQSVKVSGDLSIYAIGRENFDLDKNRYTGQDFPTGQAEPPTGMSDESFIMSIIEVQIDADLTDNVSTVVRIVNQGNWGDDFKKLRDPAAPQNNYESIGNDLIDLGVDLAYVQLNEFFFEPLTLTIGRQDIWFGRGMIIGANLVDPGMVEAYMPNDAAERLRGIGAPELTAYRSFDAARATIDFEQYAPLVVDLVYFRNSQGTLSSNSVDVVGINAGYNWDIYNAEAEAYYWFRKNNEDGSNRIESSDQIHTIGTRGSFNPTEDWLFGGEAALQVGRRVITFPTSTTTDGDAAHNGQSRFAGMMDAFVEYLGWQQYMYSPKIGAEVIWTSGDDEDPGDRGDTFTGWHPMSRGYFPTMIKPYLGRYYFTSRYPRGEDQPFTNNWEILFKGSIQPLDDLTVEGTVAQYYLDKKPIRLGETGDNGFLTSHDLGTEINVVTTFDYTEDVTFSLASAYFWEGDVYDEQSDQNTMPDTPTDLNPTHAAEVIGSVKVSF